jgi:mycothiol synthase
MNAAANAARTLNGDPGLGTVAEMDNHYAHLEHADLARDCAIVELDGAIVAYGRTSIDAPITGGRELWGVINVDPSAGGLGIEKLLVDHSLRRSAELIASMPPGETTRIVLYAGDRDLALRGALENAGFRIIRSSGRLVRPSLDDIPEVSLPEGIDIRPISPHDREMHRRVFDASGRAFAESYGEEAATDDKFAEFVASPELDPTLWRVAFHGDDIAGQILNYMDDPLPDGSRIGWTEGISVQPEFRRRGLARALLAESLRAVRDAGATTAALGVDMQNPNQAQALYESMGYEVIAVTYDYELGPFETGIRPRLVTEAAK